MENVETTNNDIELAEKHETDEECIDEMPKEVLKLFNIEKY